ncbi:MAG: YceI family protein [Actinomycetota bacterium]|nr:YceI family protein [Actinomycetota bacterium]MDQ3647965.1 YceI family protein [Actinomycetota bacterium]
MTVAEQQVPTGTWEVDRVHSSIGFEVKHMVVSTFRSKFDDYDAWLSDAGGEPKLVGTVRVESIEAKDENLAGHLQSPEFFDSVRTPEIRFESSAFRREGDELTVEGDLTIKGITHPVQARGTISGPQENIAGKEGLGLELETTVDRTAYGLAWNAPLPKGGFALANDVKLKVALELVRQ